MGRSQKIGREGGGKKEDTEWGVLAVGTVATEAVSSNILVLGALDGLLAILTQQCIVSPC